MNLRLFSVALLISALPLPSIANSSISFDRADFAAAEQINREGEAILKVKLTKSGKAKLKKLNEQSSNRRVHIQISGVSSDLTLRDSIQGDGLELGPYSRENAQTMVTTINSTK